MIAVPQEDDVIPQAASLSEFFGRTYWVIEQQTAGLTTADSLLQPPFGGNCLNWVLGHIITERDAVLEYLGRPPLWTEVESQLYRRTSEPLVDVTHALPLEQLLQTLATSQERITTALATISAEAFAAPSGTSTVGQRVAFKLWHETYHIGQLEVFRNLAGKHEQII